MPALRLHLPPNLPAAAARGAVPLRVEYDPGAEPDPAILPALALLQRWCGTPRPPAFIELTRAQMRDLALACGRQAVFVEAGRAAPWAHADLLADPPEPKALADPVPPLRRTRPAGEPLTIDGSEHYLAATLPSREHPGYAEALELLKASGFVLEPSNRKWWLRDRHKTLNFLAVHGGRLRRSGARFTPGFESRTGNLTQAEVTCEAAPARGGWDVSIGLGGPSEAAVRDAVAAGRSYAESDGRVVLIDPEQLRRVQQAQRALAGSSTAGARASARVAAARLPEVEDLLAELSPGFRPPEEWTRRSEGLRALSRLEAAPALSQVLRPYQRLGAAWLWHLHRTGLGGVLADEMGLGKTLQALALLASARGAGRAHLVVCPASLAENWRREAARFAPQLRVFVHHGAARLAGAADLAAWDLVITSYGTLCRDADLFSGAQLGCVVADEGQHIKNPRSQNARAIRSLRAESRFILTGTPVENSLDDLRSIFDFVLPGYLEPVPAGARGEERGWHDARLRAKVAHYILRRTKAAVAPELPARIEQVVWCAMEPAQEAVYRAFRERSERELADLQASGAGEAALRLAALTQLLRLRQICCDPRLVERGPAPAPGYDGSAKLESLRELLSEAASGGHRVLLFSQFTSLLALVRAELDAQAAPYCYLDGSMAPGERQAQVDRFQSDGSVPLFLLSLKAGGTGLNLTGADTVVHFDPWWNPAAEAQATDRAHRIGQTRIVTSYKLVCPGTVEEKVLALQDEKRALLADVFEASDAAAARLSLADLRSLLGG